MSESAPDTWTQTPEVWPACRACGTAWVLRRTLSISQGRIWVWQADCKHRTAPGIPLVMQEVDGIVQEVPDSAPAGDPQ